jgi:hypothetical protein
VTDSEELLSQVAAFDEAVSEFRDTPAGHLEDPSDVSQDQLTEAIPVLRDLIGRCSDLVDRVREAGASETALQDTLESLRAHLSRLEYFASMPPKAQRCPQCQRDLSRRKHQPGCPLGPPWDS